MRINFDHISSCPIDPDIITGSGQIMRDFYANPNSFHELGRKAKAKIEKSRIFFAESLNVSPGELFFQYDAITQTKQLIDYCILILDIGHIVTSVFENASTLNYLKTLEKNHKISLSFITENPIGDIDINALDELLQASPKSLLSLSHANGYNGMLLPVKDIIKLCKKSNTLFHLNLSSTIGNYNIDIQKIKTDFITFDFSAQYGNKNTGIFFLNQAVKITDEAYHQLKTSYKEGENINTEPITAIARTFYNALNNLQSNMVLIKSVRNYLILQMNKHFKLNHILASYNKEGIFTVLSYFFPKKIFGNYLAEKLDINGISVAKINYPYNLNNEHGSYLRFSFGKDNTAEQIDVLIATLNDLIAKNK